MSVSLAAIAATVLSVGYYGFKKKDPSVRLGSCFFERLAVPAYTIMNEYYSNSGLMVDEIDKNSVAINTPLKTLYGVELKTGSNIHHYLHKDTIGEIINSYKGISDASIYYVLHKQNEWHRQYIFTHNLSIARLLAGSFNTHLMSGLELVNALLDLFLQNGFYVDDDKRDIKRRLELLQDSQMSEPEFMQFKRAAREAIYNSLNEVDIYQGFKPLERIETDILSVFHAPFEGSIWFMFDFNESRIKGQINKLLNEAKLTGNRTPFLELKNLYNAGNEELVLVNSSMFLKKYEADTVSSLGVNLKTTFIKRELLRANSIRKTPLKYRDIDFDCLVKADFLHQFIASVHKARCNKADIYGVDKNGGFVNFSFSAENNNPHSVIIARPGSGKSVAKQKIMSQMIKLDFTSGVAKNLGSNPGNVKIRSYDIGFSDENFITMLKSNPKNRVAHIESSFYRFKYNLIATEMTRNRDFGALSEDERAAFNADVIFASELASLILSSTGDGAGLNSGEKSLFIEIIKDLYIKKDYIHYRIKELTRDHMDLFEELVGKEDSDGQKVGGLGYDQDTLLVDIKEEKYNFLKKPLLKDAIKIASIGAQNQQIREADRELYKSLHAKLGIIDKLGIFSTFDRVDIIDADVLSMDLNDFKESALFVPIFYCIFQKTYLKDRQFALECKRAHRPAPKLFYAIEEAKNFFRDNETFEAMFDKVTLEARKYNVHLCFIVQNAEHLPRFISKNIDTRIFLLESGSKRDVVKEADEVFNIPDDTKEAILNTERFELCVWYKLGVFHMRFIIPADEMRVFNTNPNEA